jgi:phospholipid/cholesterol/gamma-HCH transport system ATP-binding protein
MVGHSSEPVLRFEHVWLYFEDKPALEDVSFEILEGETRIIMGASGSGKTVLLKTALGLLKPDSGRVFVFGQDITRLNESELFDIRARIGVLFQEGGLFDSLTVEENVAYPLVNQKAAPRPLEDVRERVEEALRFVELEQTMDKLPSELSGGMRRRVGIARAIASKPALLLYDSPTAGLDPITAYTIVTLIIKERDTRKATTVVVTHRYQDGAWMANFRYNPESGCLEPLRNGSSTERRTRLMVLREGRIVFEGERCEFEAARDPYLVKFIKR